MAKRHERPTPAATAFVSPRTLGLLGALSFVAGLVLLALYPVDVAERLMGGYEWPADGSTLPGPPKFRWLVPSGVVGPLLVILGAFAAWDRTTKPLTPRRALLAPALGALSLGAGVVRFVYSMAQETPVVLNTDTGGERTFDPSIAELLGYVDVSAHFVFLASTATLVVGSVAARYGWRRALASAALPAVLLAIAELREPFLRTLSGLNLLLNLGVLAVFLAGPFALGYLATERSGRSVGRV